MNQIYLDEKLVGETDVKSTPTYFSVQRSNPFTKNDTPIPFDTALVNTGKAMNLSWAIFTAPVAGIYSFSFHGLVEFQATQSAIPFLAVGSFTNISFHNNVLFIYYLIGGGIRNKKSVDF